MLQKIFVIQSNTSNIPDVVTNILEFIKVKNMRLDEDNQFRIKLVLNEMITNSVVHGNHENSNKKVTIKMNVKKVA